MQNLLNLLSIKDKGCSWWMRSHTLFDILLKKQPNWSLLSCKYFSQVAWRKACQKVGWLTELCDTMSWKVWYRSVIHIQQFFDSWIFHCFRMVLNICEIGLLAYFAVNVPRFQQFCNKHHFLQIKKWANKVPVHYMSLQGQHSK